MFYDIQIMEQLEKIMESTLEQKNRSTYVTFHTTDDTVAHDRRN